MPERSDHRLAGGSLFVVFTLLSWASVPLFLRYFVDYIDPWTANGWRYAFSAMLWAPFLVAALYRGTLPPHIWKLALVPSLINCLGQVPFAMAHYQIGPGLVAFLIRFQIIFVTLGAYFLFPSERGVLRSPLFWIGLFLVLGGSIGTATLGGKALTTEEIKGVAMGIVAGVIFGCYPLAVRYYMRGIPSILSFAVICQYSALAMLVIMPFYAEDYGAAPLHLPAGRFWMLVVSALVGIALGHVCYYASIARLGVSISAGVTLMAPFLTAVASQYLFGELLTKGQWVAGVLATIGAGMILGTQRRYRPETASAAEEA